MRYQITCYVPKSHVELVKQAMFDSGAGQFEGYGQCCWQTVGRGQFLSHADANPHIGEIGKITTVEEIKLEIFCVASHIHSVIRAMKHAHPYEVPAYAVFALCTEF